MNSPNQNNAAREKGGVPTTSTTNFSTEVATNSRVLLTQGVEWLKTQQQEVASLYRQALLTSSEVNFYRNIPTVQLERIVTMNLQSLIQRLEGTTLDTDQMRLTLAAGYRQGLMQLQDTIVGADLMLQTIKLKATEDLAPTQIEVYRTLLVKIGYIVTIMKSTMAAAQVENITHPSKHLRLS